MQIIPMLGLMASFLGCASRQSCEESADEAMCTTEIASSSSTGDEGNKICEPNSSQACYTNRPETENQGLCKAGRQTCVQDGSEWGGCAGEVGPQVELCDTGPLDENCDGQSMCVGTPSWCQHFGNNADYQYGLSLASDREGNIFMTGWFWSSIDFGGGVLNAVDRSDIFLVKFTPQGEHLWSRSFGSSGYDAGHDVAVDAMGNVAITGWFEGKIQFGADSVVNELGQRSMYLSKFTGNGEHLWTYATKETTKAEGLSVDIADDGMLAVSGAFQQSIVLAGENYLTPDNGYNGFLITFSADGESLWSKGFGGEGDDWGDSVAFGPPGYVHMAGTFANSFDVGKPLKSQSSDSHEIFVTQFSSEGKHRWSLALELFPYINSKVKLLTDSQGDIVLTANIGMQVGKEMLLAKLAKNNGTTLWSQSITGAQTYLARQIAVDDADHILFSGMFWNQLQLGEFLLAGAEESRIFVSKWHGHDGSVIWASTFGGEGVHENYGLTVQPTGDVWISGGFKQSFDCTQSLLTSYGETDVMLARLLP